MLTIKKFLLLLSASILLNACSKGSGGNNNTTPDTIVWEKETNNENWVNSGMTIQGIIIVQRDVETQQLDNVSYNYITVEEKYATDNNWTLLSNTDVAVAVNSSMHIDVYKEIIGVPRLIRIYNVNYRQEQSKIRIRAYRRN